MTTWSYDELTEHTSAEITRFIHYSLAAKRQNNTDEWQTWRDYAYGTYHTWDRLTRGKQKEGDGDRLYELIPDDMPPEVTDHTDLIMRILELVEDETLWTPAHIAAFQRGKIIGMCARAGIRVRKEKQEKS
jgi:hypothetical protein